MWLSETFRLLRFIILWLLGLPAIALLLFACMVLAGPFSSYDASVQEPMNREIDPVAFVNATQSSSDARNYVVRADFNGDGQSEYLFSRTEDNLFDHWFDLELIGKSNGKSVEYFHFTCPNFGEIKLTDGSTAFTTPGLTWNHSAYRWRNGRYRIRHVKSSEVQDQADLRRWDEERHEMVERFWAGVYAPVNDRSLWPIGCILSPILSVWLLLLMAPWVFQARGRAVCTLKVPGAVIASSLLVSWFNYHYFGYEDLAVWRFYVLLVTFLSSCLLLAMAGFRALYASHKSAISSTGR